MDFEADATVLKFLHSMGISAETFTHTGNSLIFNDGSGELQEIPPVIMDFDKVGISLKPVDMPNTQVFYAIQEDSRFYLADESSA